MRVEWKINEVYMVEVWPCKTCDEKIKPKKSKRKLVFLVKAIFSIWNCDKINGLREIYWKVVNERVQEKGVVVK